MCVGGSCIYTYIKYYIVKCTLQTSKILSYLSTPFKHLQDKFSTVLFHYYGNSPKNGSNIKKKSTTCTHYF